VRRTRTACATLIAVAALAAAPAHAFRVTTWNLLNYPDLDLAGRQPKFRTVMAALPTDVMIVQELHSDAGADSFMMNVLQVSQPTRVWRKGGFISAAESAVFYDETTVASVSNVASFSDGGPRQVLVCLVKPRGYLTNPGWFRLYSIHLKAGDGSITPSDSGTRTVECTAIRSTINATSIGVVGPNFLLGGDTNFYGAFETGYTRLTESQSNNNGRCRDVLTMPGNWHVESGYAAYDTQCPCGTGCSAGFSGGGMDDRFDIIFSSYSLQDAAGMDVVGYGAFGNDGHHFNDDINGSGFNTVVPIAVANALHDASDHLPVLMTLQLPAKVAAVSHLEFGSTIVGGTGQQALAVANGATAPAASLNYSLSAPAGFTAPVGGFTAAAGQPANSHTLGISAATAGVKTGTLTVASDDPDSASKPVQLTGTVLRHAVPSLDSATVVTQQNLDLGTHTEATFSDGTVRVFDQGYTTLQARLSLDAAEIQGGDGRFSIAGGFTPGLVAGTGRSFGIHFDPGGAALDSAYTATLILHDSDEPLPGATPGADLTVQLSATLSHALGVTPPARALRFEPPRPNPFAAATRFAFELPEAAPVTLAIFDPSGRRVATLAWGTWSAGRHEVVWNGADDRGAPAGAGLFFAQFRTAGLTRTVRLARLP
jgi:flagellar hook capping protein FlgD